MRSLQCMQWEQHWCEEGTLETPVSEVQGPEQAYKGDGALRPREVWKEPGKNFSLLFQSPVCPLFPLTHCPEIYGTLAQGNGKGR